MRFASRTFTLAATMITIAKGQPPKIFSPADGFYLCGKEGAECLVTGCEESGDCSIMENGFEKGISEFGKSIYKSTRPGASLSIIVSTDSTATTEVSCEGECGCQWITSDIGGCVPAPPKVVSAVSTTNTNGQQEAEKEGTTISNITPPTVTQSILIGVLIPLFVIFVAGMIWYGMRRRRRRQQQQEKEEEDNKSVIFEVQTHGGDEEESMLNNDDDEDNNSTTATMDEYRISPENDNIYDPEFNINIIPTTEVVQQTTTTTTNYDEFDETESVEMSLK